MGLQSKRGLNGRSRHHYPILSSKSLAILQPDILLQERYITNSYEILF